IEILRKLNQISFQANYFKCVCKISLLDERCFKHELLKSILTKSNSQNDKKCRKPKTDNQALSIIEYLNLNEFDYNKVHDDYAQKILANNQMCLPNNVYLLIDNRFLESVTDNFTRDAKLSCIDFSNESKISQDFKDYLLH
ncbi:unnamed protein product, partial [Rotaria sordida]